MNKQNLKEPSNFIKTNLSFKDYFAYIDKIVFKANVSKFGKIKISKYLKNFTRFDYLYVKINNKFKKFKICRYHDRKCEAYVVPVGSRYKYESFEAYLETTPKFNNILKKAFNNKSNSIDFYSDDNFRMVINNDGNLLLRFLTPSLARGKEFYIIHNMFRSNKRSITLNGLKRVLNSLKIESQLITPFIKNYFVAKLKKEIKFPPAKLKSQGALYRAIGIINGDGHLGHGMILCYGNDKIIHDDFRKGLEHTHQPLKLKCTVAKISNVNRTQINSTMLLNKLAKLGAVGGNKLKNMEKINIPNDFHTYSGYLGGIFDTEGAFIKDSHLVLPTSISIKSKEFSLINENQNDFLLKLAKEKCNYQKLKCSNSEYYILGLRLLKKINQGETIIKKISNSPPPITLLNKNILDELGIYSKMELKSLYVYPKSKNINANWWVKITPIKDIIKFYSLIDIHSINKREKIKNFVFQYITQQDFQEIEAFVKKNLRSYNGSSNN